MSETSPIEQFQASVIAFEQVRQDNNTNRADVMADPECVDALTRLESLAGDDEVISFYAEGLRRYRAGEPERVQAEIAVLQDRIERMVEASLLPPARGVKLQAQAETGELVKKEAELFFKLFKPVMSPEETEAAEQQAREEFIAQYRLEPTEDEASLSPRGFILSRLRALRLSTPKTRADTERLAVDAILLSRHISTLDETTLPEEAARSFQQQCMGFLTRTVEPKISFVYKKYLGAKPGREDIIMAAVNSGIAGAFRRFDPTKGVMFLTYLTSTVEGEIKHALRDDTLSRGLLKRAVWEQYITIDKLMSDGLSDAQVAAEMHMKPQELQHFLDEHDQYAETGLSLDAPINGGTTARGDLMADRRQEPTIDSLEALVTLGERIAAMDFSDRERSLLELAFGIRVTDDGVHINAHVDTYSPTEIGKKLGYAQSYVSRLIKQLRRRIGGRDVHVVQPLDQVAAGEVA